MTSLGFSFFLLGHLGSSWGGSCQKEFPPNPGQGRSRQYKSFGSYFKHTEIRTESFGIDVPPCGFSCFLLGAAKTTTTTATTRIIFEARLSYLTKSGPPLAFPFSFWGLSAHPGGAPAPPDHRPPTSKHLDLPWLFLFPFGASRLIPGGLPPPRTPPVVSSSQAAHVKATEQSSRRSVCPRRFRARLSYSTVS